MTTAEKIQHINWVLQEYFEHHPDSPPIPAKDFMPQFIKAGIFTTDHKNGLPIRNLLRSLDAYGQLGQIPYFIAERKKQNTSWFFAPARKDRLIKVRPAAAVTTPKSKAVANGSKPRSHSDECYVLDLCDEVLGLNSVRQQRFPFLVGDPNSAGRCVRLPVDAWYEPLNLVIEYNERQHTEPVKHFDKRMTLSGVHRGEQRALYDHRKRTVLPQYGIQVIVLSYSDFVHNRSKRLIRDIGKDLEGIKSRLIQYVKDK